MATTRNGVNPVTRVLYDPSGRPLEWRDPFAELGLTGLTIQSGFVQEEFLRELQGPRGMRTYREMRDNDAVVGAILFTFEFLARQVDWKVKAANAEQQAVEIADFVQACLDDMSFSWQDTLGEIMSMLPFGFSFLEVVYKKRSGQSQNPAERSRYSDGKIGWRKWSIRAQETVYRWLLDENGGIQGVEQIAPPDYLNRTIPITKSLLFRTRVWRNNPEGRSLLRNAYRSWYFMKRIEEGEAIGVERDLVGMPMITPPEALDIWNPNDPVAVAQKAAAEKIVRNIRRDEQEGIVKPFGWEFELLNSGGSRQFDTIGIINRYAHRIAMSVLADFLMVGSSDGGRGSFALSRDKTRLFSLSLGGFLDNIADTITRHGIPRLLELNGYPLELAPTLDHTAIEDTDLQALGDFIAKIAGAGAPLFPDDSLENALRDLARVPLKPGTATITKRDPVRMAASIRAVRHALSAVGVPVRG